MVLLGEHFPLAEKLLAEVDETEKIMGRIRGKMGRGRGDGSGRFLLSCYSAIFNVSL